jgi:glyoxylase-like metal-dependent hydrolase (beta-lactamase superfamily II)
MLFSALLLFCFFSSAQAEAPMVKTQVPGYYRMMLGQFEVTALYDGFVEMDAKLLINASEQEIQALLSRMFVGGPKMSAATNAYLINTGSKLVLVDTGAGKVFGPTLGSVIQNLKAAGYDPAQIDAVMISHMHGDHVGGLLDESGKPAFSNAVVYVSKRENDFWLSPAIAEKAPAEYKKYFKMARDLAAPYIALGKWKTFGDGEMPVPGVKAVLIPGHTPGHTAYEVSDGKEALLITGDMVHSLAVQFPRPDVAFEYDTDKGQAVSVRLALFKSAAERKVLVAGMHLPFPGIGRIRANGRNAYAWLPVEFSPIRGSMGATQY